MAASVAKRIAERLTPAIETAVDPKNRFLAKFQNYPFLTLAKFLALPVGLVFTLSTVPLVSNTKLTSFWGWRILAHLGPYHIPRLVESEEWKLSLEQLAKASELQLIESEIAQLLSNIEVVSQRKMAVKKITSKFGFSVFVPVFQNLAAPPPVNTWRKSQSHFEANLRVAMDLVSATPARERKLDISVIENILTNNKDLWESDLNIDSKRFREYRALLLLKLLQNESNLESAKRSDVVKSFLDSEIAFAKHQPFPALPLVPLLYQFKVDKLGFEFIDIIKRSRELMGLPRVEEEKADSTRKSLALEHKLDFVNFEKLVYLTICYASLRVVPLISEYSVKVLSRAANVIARSVLGATLLETTYRAEEHLIQTAPWYEASGLFSSAAMTASNVFFGALALKYFPYCGVPWLMIRVKDSFSDTFRFI